MAVNRSGVNVGYGLSNALQDLAPQPIVANRNPGAADKAELGTIWVNPNTENYYVATATASNQTTWVSAGVPVAVLTAGTTPVLNAQAGVVTFTGRTTAMGANQTVVITNSFITAGSPILASIYNLNASANGAGVTIRYSIVANGSLTVNYINNGAGALGAGDNVILTFQVLS